MASCVLSCWKTRNFLDRGKSSIFRLVALIPYSVDLPLCIAKRTPFESDIEYDSARINETEGSRWKSKAPLTCTHHHNRSIASAMILVFNQIITSLKTWLHVMIQCCFDKILVNLLLPHEMNNGKATRLTVERMDFCWCFMEKSNKTVRHEVFCICFDDDATNAWNTNVENFSGLFGKL